MNNLRNNRPRKNQPRCKKTPLRRPHPICPMTTHPPLPPCKPILDRRTRQQDALAVDAASRHHTLADLVRACAGLEFAVVHGGICSPRPLECVVEVVSALQEPGAGVWAGAEVFLGTTGWSLLGDVFGAR